jgi:hypothetical protein
LSKISFKKSIKMIKNKWLITVSKILMAFLPIRPRPVGGLEVLGDELGDERMN